MNMTATVIDRTGEQLGSFKVPGREDDGQLSMKVGGEAVGKHLFGTIRIAGSLKVDRDLDLGDEVRVQIVDAQGEIIGQAGAHVEPPAFVSHEDDGEIVAIGAAA